MMQSSCKSKPEPKLNRLNKFINIFSGNQWPYLWNEIINGIEEHGTGSKNDWGETKARLLSKVAAVCEIAYRKTQPLTAADEMACALHITNTLSLYEFEVAVPQMLRHKNKQVIVLTCFLLANPHYPFLFSKMERRDDWYGTKYEIMRNCLQSLDKDFTKDKTNCDFLIGCAELMKDNHLEKEIKKRCSQQHTTTSKPKTQSPANKQSTNENHALLEVVVADGKINERARDPPGQRSVYIPPGDLYKESYRLSTFIKYPQEVPVNPRHLASAGFYYTGYKDRVKCFSCGLCCEDWKYGDDVRSKRWHRNDCGFATNGNHENIPLRRGIVTVNTTSESRESNIHNVVQTTNNNLTSSKRSASCVPSPPSSSSSSSTQSNAVQSARPDRRNGPLYRIVEFATILSAYHQNVLSRLDLRKESERLRSFEHWPSETPTVNTADLAESGFFYLGNLDRVQCFSCGGVLRNWNYGDVVEYEHRRHFPHCRLCRRVEQRNVALSSDERAAAQAQPVVFREPPDPSESEARDLRNMFQCQFPLNPRMRNEDTRFETFDHRWPSAQINATPQQIAKAGFFFLGERDRVKCWYCNGGLQNWDGRDEPWTEHAKWFPTCEFLLQRKGPDFVHRMVSMFPNLPRPLLSVPSSSGTQDGANFLPARNNVAQIKAADNLPSDLGQSTSSEWNPLQQRQAQWSHVPSHEDEAYSSATCSFNERLAQQERDPSHRLQTQPMLTDWPGGAPPGGHSASTSRGYLQPSEDIESLSVALLQHAAMLRQQSSDLPVSDRPVWFRQQAQKSSQLPNRTAKADHYNLALRYAFHLPLVEFNYLCGNGRSAMSSEPSFLLALAYALAQPRVVDGLMLRMPEQCMLCDKTASFRAFLAGLDGCLELRAVIDLCRRILESGDNLPW